MNSVDEAISANPRESNPGTAIDLTQTSASTAGTAMSMYSLTSVPCLYRYSSSSPPMMTNATVLTTHLRVLESA
ncbi:hypothetical protein D3C73_1449910 [compost metagenome]